jgi:hypothetical protein
LLSNARLNKGKLTRSFSHLEADSIRPDILQLQGRLLPNEFSLIPGRMLLCSVNGLLHDELPTCVNDESSLNRPHESPVSDPERPVINVCYGEIL